MTFRDGVVNVFEGRNNGSIWCVDVTWIVRSFIYKLKSNYIIIFNVK